MTALRFEGIADSVAAEVRTTMRAPQYGHPAHRELAQSYGPCRLCLRTFTKGQEDRILFTYQPFTETGSLPSPGPVFIHAESCARYNADTMPPDFRSLSLVFEAYGPGGRLLAQHRAGVGASDEAVREFFEQTGADYVHIRNGVAGCFMARATRATGGSPSCSA